VVAQDWAKWHRLLNIGGRDSRVVNVSDFECSWPGWVPIPVGAKAKKFSDGTCKYLLALS